MSLLDTTVKCTLGIHRFLQIRKKSLSLKSRVTPFDGHCWGRNQGASYFCIEAVLGLVHGSVDLCLFTCTVLCLLYVLERNLKL